MGSCGPGPPESVRLHYQTEGVAAYYSSSFYQNPHEERVKAVLRHCWERWQLFADPADDANGEIQILDLSAGNGEITNALLELLWEADTAASQEMLSASGTGGDAEPPGPLGSSTSPRSPPTPPRRVRILATDPYTHAAYDRRFAHLTRGATTSRTTKKTGSKNSSLKSSSSTSALPKSLVVDAASSGRSLHCLPVSFEDILEDGLISALVSTTAGTTPHATPQDGAGAARPIDLAICSYALHLATSQQLPVLAMQLALGVRKLLIVTPHKRPVLEEAWGWRRREEVVKDRTRAVLYESLLL